jgi:hypothetical protein
MLAGEYAKYRGKIYDSGENDNRAPCPRWAPLYCITWLTIGAFRLRALGLAVGIVSSTSMTSATIGDT